MLILNIKNLVNLKQTKKNAIKGNNSPLFYIY